MNKYKEPSILEQLLEVYGQNGLARMIRESALKIKNKRGGESKEKIGLRLQQPTIGYWLHKRGAQIPHSYWQTVEIATSFEMSPLRVTVDDLKKEHINRIPR